MGKKRGTSNAIDGTEDDTVFDGTDDNSSDGSNTNGGINDKSDSIESEDKLNIVSQSYVNKNYYEVTSSVRCFP